MKCVRRRDGGLARLNESGGFPNVGPREVCMEQRLTYAPADNL